MTVIDSHSIEAPVILALDIGTSSIRCSVFDRWGRAAVGLESRRSLAVRTGTDGTSEADPDELLGILFGCLDEVLERAGSRATGIAGVAACTFVNNIMGVDQDNRPVTPLITYADTRARGEAEVLKAEFDEAEIHERTGCHFHPSYLPARLRWLARTRPEAFGQTARWISLGEYWELKLFGRAAVSYSVASWTGLLDRHGLVWDEELLAAVGVTAGQLSPLTDVGVSRQGLRPEFASRWPALRSTPWFPAVGDGAAANIGAGCDRPDRIALTVGTSSAMRAVVPGSVDKVPDGLWCYRVDRERSLPGGALSEGGSVFAWLNSVLNLENPDAVEQALAVMEPDGHGLTVLPFLSGERSPGWAGHARCTIHGATMATTPMDMVRAGLESVAYRLAMVHDLLRPLLPDNPKVLAGGGALLGSPAWLGIMADVLGREVFVPDIEEVSARGAALLALEALGLETPAFDFSPESIRAVYYPDRKRHEVYRRAMARQQDLYGRLVGHARPL